MIDRAPSRKSLLERAEGVYDFANALRGKGLPPPKVDEAQLPPLPQPVAQPAAAAAPADQVATTALAPPVVRPVPRARNWTGPAQTIDRARMAELGYLVPQGDTTALSEEFRIVKRDLLVTMRGTGQAGVAASGASIGASSGNVILIASAHGGDGKTFCAVNLAVSLAAEADLEVLLVDGDVAKPGIVQDLGLVDGPGLMDVLVDPAVDVEDCVIRTDVPSLCVLPSGKATNRDAEFLASSRMNGLIERLVAGRPDRIVLFDSPPLLAASPAAVLASHVGQTVLVVRADRTSEAALRDAANLLRGCGHVRLLLNGVKYSASGRRFGTYYGKEG